MYNKGMKPMKVMRYGGTNRYNRSKPKSNKLLIAIIAGIVVVALAVVIILRMAAIKKMQEDNGTLNLAMRDGTPVTMEVETGDICMLTMPGAIDMREVEFTSSDSDIVRVDSAGHADALKEGEATVTATARNFTAECIFKVSPDTDPGPEEEITTAIAANQDILDANIASGRTDLYSITANRRTNTVTVYTFDDKGEYTVPIRAMVCSCGKGGEYTTITGDFSVYFQTPWHPLYDNVYGMFVSGFKDDFLFHSVPYESQSHHDLETEEFNKLGEPASQGCVRMMAADVRWIFRNCDIGTPVHVIDADSSADPLGKPKTVRLPLDVKWDPTDIDPYNPYLGKTPTIEGVADAVITEGESFDPMAGVTATDMFGQNINDRVTVAGEVLSNKPGQYNLTYTYTDEFRQRARETCTVTVNAK